MKNRHISTERPLPVSMMVWTIPDAVIEDRSLLETQFSDLLNAGFDGVAVYVRCSRYTWDDPPARTALTRISALCRKTGLHLWVGADPRFISRQLIRAGGGAELLLFGNSSRSERVPNTAPVIDGRFSVRCMIQPRHGHMFNEVALEYAPIGILRCYAVRNTPGPVRARDILDISERCRFFYNARDRYIEAFGKFTPPDGSDWNVAAFFHVQSTHVDYSSRRQMLDYAGRLNRLHDAGVVLQSLMWDEAGYTCTYGSLPFTRTIRSKFRRSAGYPLERSLWKLAFDAADGSHVPMRVQYYNVVQETVNDAQRFTNRFMRRLWGPGTIASVHDTWHFESADMCDMNHGSLDLWKAGKVKSGGFVDLGAINTLHEPESPYYANLAAMSVIAASLGRWSKRHFAFNNLWTVGDDGGTGSQREAMDHCVNVMALFGTRWLAHAYGPAGTIGEETTFLGSPPLPGYPQHSTWAGFPEWNERLRSHVAACDGRLPWVNVLLVFPVEAMLALADTRADRDASGVFNLLLALVDAQFQIDVLSPEDVVSGKWQANRLLLGRTSYEAIILPLAHVVNGRLLTLLRRNNSRTLFFGMTPERTVDNKIIKLQAETIADCSGVIRKLEREEIGRPFRGPTGTWVTATKTSRGFVLSIVPSRRGFAYEGNATCGTSSLTVPKTRGLTRILFTPEGTARILQ